MQLTTEQQAWLAGEHGPSLAWAMDFNRSLGEFFDAEKMLPISSAHFAPDLRMGGKASLDLLQRTADDGAKVVVPSYLDPCSVDIVRAAKMVTEYGIEQNFADSEKLMRRLCQQIGFVPTYSCVVYQTVSPPAAGGTSGLG